MEGKIIRQTGGLYTIVTPDGEVSCRAKGAFRHEGEKPLAGDNVTLRGSNGEYQIETICQRKNSLIRPPVSNLDKLFVVVAAKSPDPILLTIDKLTIIAEHNKIEPIIVITKDDLDHESALAIESIYKSSGFTTFISNPQKGADEIKEYIKTNCANDIIAFAGNSGVGKSTLMNALFPTLALETGEVSEKTERGKHTTRTVELYSLGQLLGIECDGYIADTPGFSMLDFVRFDFISKEDLPYAFREFGDYIGYCKYTKCSHTVEDGCAILEAMRNGEVRKSRHDSFCAIYNDIKDKHKWD